MTTEPQHAKHGGNEKERGERHHKLDGDDIHHQHAKPPHTHLLAWSIPQAHVVWLVVFLTLLVSPLLASGQGPLVQQTQIQVRDATTAITWKTLPAGPCLLLYDRNAEQFGKFSCAAVGAGVAVGASGALQASNGAGGVQPYGGSQCSTTGTFAKGIDANGGLACAPPTSGTAAVLLAQGSTDFPNGVNLGGKGPGLLQSTVSNGVATVSTLALPNGALVGAAGASGGGQQTLTNTALTRRILSLSTTTTPLTMDITTFDVAVASELSQDTLFANPTPTGGGMAGQQIQLQIHSTLVRQITWGTTWGAGPQVPLPTATTGGTTDDLWTFQYNARTGKWVITQNSQLASPPATSGVTAGAYTCPSALTVNAQGLVTAITGAACAGGGGGSATPAGVDGDVQINTAGALGADSSTFAYDIGSHTLGVTNVQTSYAGGYQDFCDVTGLCVTVMSPSVLTQNRLQLHPDEDGTLCVKGGSCFTSTVSVSGTPTAGQTAVWASATTLQAGKVTLTAPATSATITIADGKTLTASNTLTLAGTDGTTLTFQGTDTYVGRATTDTLTNKRITKRVTTLATSTTYTCPGDTSDQCKMAMTGVSGTLTMATPTGTPNDGDMLLFRIRCTNSQTFSWSATFLASPTVILPTTCPANVTRDMVMGFLYSSDLVKWQILASN